MPRTVEAGLVVERQFPLQLLLLHRQATAFEDLLLVVARQRGDLRLKPPVEKKKFYFRKKNPKKSLKNVKDPKWNAGTRLEVKKKQKKNKKKTKHDRKFTNDRFQTGRLKGRTNSFSMQ